MILALAGKSSATSFANRTKKMATNCTNYTKAWKDTLLLTPNGPAEAYPSKPGLTQAVGGIREIRSLFFL